MKVSFELTEKDYVEYNIFHNFNSKSGRKVLIISRFIPPVGFMLMPFFLTKVSMVPFWWWLITFTILSVVWIVRYPKNVKRNIAKRIKKMLGEGKNLGLLGNKTIVLTEEAIISEGESGETKTKWNAVERFCETSEYLFVYIAAVMAYIIPVRAFASIEERNEFVLLIKKNVKNTTGRDI